VVPVFVPYVVACDIYRQKAAEAKQSATSAPQPSGGDEKWSIRLSNRTPLLSGKAK